MSRSGYDEDGDCSRWELFMWRKKVDSAMAAKRGQAFLRDMIASLDALLEKKLIAESLCVDSDDGAFHVCAIGAVGLARGVDMSNLDPENTERVARVFNISDPMTKEIVYINDVFGLTGERQEDRWHRMRAWAVSKFKGDRDGK
jgi:hypothetical protein